MKEGKEHYAEMKERARHRENWSLEPAGRQMMMMKVSNDDDDESIYDKDNPMLARFFTLVA